MRSMVEGESRERCASWTPLSATALERDDPLPVPGRTSSLQRGFTHRRTQAGTMRAGREEE
ncbi:hypothetical protein AB5I41_15630 [Sphingomonas sp. MMS24-JH45]